jgi:hypothetical protein
MYPRVTNNEVEEVWGMILYVMYPYKPLGLYNTTLMCTNLKKKLGDIEITARQTD